MLTAHVIFIVGAVTYWALAAIAGNNPDANIGIGLGAYLVALLGVPWTIPLFDDQVSFTAVALLGAVGALLNLALHALLWFTLRRWSRRRESTTGNAVRAGSGRATYGSEE